MLFQQKIKIEYFTSNFKCSLKIIQQLIARIYFFFLVIFEKFLLKYTDMKVKNVFYVIVKFLFKLTRSLIQIELNNILC